MHLFSSFYKHFSIKFHYHLTIRNKCTMNVHPATMNSFRIFGFFLDIGGNNIDAPKIHNDYRSIKIFIFQYCDSKIVFSILLPLKISTLNLLKQEKHLYTNMSLQVCMEIHRHHSMQGTFFVYFETIENVKKEKILRTCGKQWYEYL